MILVLLALNLSSPLNSDFSFYSLKSLSTAYLMKGVEEAIQSPSYLFLLPNSHIVANFSDFSLTSLYFGGNIASSLLREGALLFLKTSNRPLQNPFGNFGFSRKDTTEIVDTNGNNVPDLIRYKEIQTDGYQKDFTISFVASFQFVGDGWFTWASFLKDQNKTEIELPGSPLNPLGYFEYKEGVITYPDSTFSGLTIANGDNVELISKNKTGGKLGSGVILGDTTFVSVFFGYNKVEDITSRGAYYSFRVRPDTVTLELSQRREDGDETYDGYELKVGFEFLDRKQNFERVFSLSYAKGTLSPDTLWWTSKNYQGRFVNVADTLFSSFESLNVSNSIWAAKKAKAYNQFTGDFAQIVNLGKDLQFAFGVRGLYLYQHSSYSLNQVDSINVSFNDGDTVRNDRDDYEKAIFSRWSGTQWTELKNYTIQLPLGIQVNPYGLKTINIRAGTIFGLSYQERSYEKTVKPIDGETEIVIYGDSTIISTSRPIGSFREREVLATQDVFVDYYVGVSFEMTRNSNFDIVMQIAKNKVQNVKAGFVVKL